MSLNNEFLKKSLLIDMGEKSPALILLLNAATLPKLFGEFCDVIDTKKTKPIKKPCLITTMKEVYY